MRVFLRGGEYPGAGRVSLDGGMDEGGGVAYECKSIFCVVEIMKKRRGSGGGKDKGEERKERGEVTKGEVADDGCLGATRERVL